MPTGELESVASVARSLLAAGVSRVVVRAGEVSVEIHGSPLPAYDAPKRPIVTDAQALADAERERELVLFGEAGPRE